MNKTRLPVSRPAKTVNGNRTTAPSFEKPDYRLHCVHAGLMARAVTVDTRSAAASRCSPDVTSAVSVVKNMLASVTIPLTVYRSSSWDQLEEALANRENDLLEELRRGKTVRNQNNAYEFAVIADRLSAANSLQLFMYVFSRSMCSRIDRFSSFTSARTALREARDFRPRLQLWHATGTFPNSPENFRGKR